MDTQFYQQYILPAAKDVLSQNLSQVGDHFANEFMNTYNARNNFQRAAEFSDYIANLTQRQNGNQQIRDAQQLYAFVEQFITLVFQEYQAQAQRQQSHFGRSDFGGGGATSFRGGGFGSGNRGGGHVGGFGSRAMPTPGAHYDDGDDENPSTARRQTQARSAPNASSGEKTVSAPQITMGVDYTVNPLDTFDPKKDELEQVEQEPTWGYDTKDPSMVILSRHVATSKDRRYVINSLVGFKRSFFSNELEVAEAFFHAAPDSFLAESFVFRLFYNYVEVVDAPTETFMAVRKKFLEDLGDGRDTSVYATIKAAIGQLQYDARMAIASYLVRHINRALFLNFAASNIPHGYIKFTQIEDLEEVLGTGFDNPILRVADSRDNLRKIVNHAILNCMAGYSDVMFTNFSKSEIEIVRTSSVFPDSIAKVYPDKTIIPGEDEGQQRFYEAMRDHVLNHKTYIRQVRCAVFSNIAGKEVLSKIGKDRTLISGFVPALLSGYALDYQAPFNLNREGLSAFDFGLETEEDQYAMYVNNPHDYTRRENASYRNNRAPTLPVDQTFFLLQYKTSPMRYLLAADVSLPMDRTASAGTALINRKEFKALRTIA